MLLKENISNFDFTAFDQAKSRATNEFVCFEFDYSKVAKPVGFKTSSVPCYALPDLRR